MLSRFRRWLGGWDRLGLRLFLLMWAALALSHLAAWSLVTQTLHAPGDEPGGPPPHLQAGADRPPPPPRDGFADGPPAPPQHGAQHVPTFPSLPPSLPWHSTLLDYGVRLFVIALAAWWGSRWLARPVRRLVSAAQRLTPALAQGQPAPVLSESDGTREVREAAAVFNRMAAELSGQFEERGLMIAAISHDLRTPLTRMRLRLETGEVEARVRERCVDDLREMNRLVESVIEVFRPAEAAALQRVDLSALAQSAVDDLAEAGAAVSFEGPPAIVTADPLALRRVVDNLVGNALRYAGNARVRVDLAAGVTRLVVEDDGPGIPEAELQRVRQPFRRVEGSRNRETGGTGLGLYIAQQLVRRQGAALVLSNRPEGGLRAEVVF